MVVDHAGHAVGARLRAAARPGRMDPTRWHPMPRRRRKAGFVAAAARDPGKRKLAVYRKSPLGLPISAETLAALDRCDSAGPRWRPCGRGDRPAVSSIAISWPILPRTVASAVAGTMRGEALRVGRPVLGDLERATRIIARFGEIVSAGEIYAGLQRLNATSRRLIADTAQYDAVLMPIIAHPPLACGAMDPKGAERVHRKRARQTAPHPAAEAQAIVRAVDGQEPVFHPLAGDPECHRPAVDRAACPCHRGEACRSASRPSAVLATRRRFCRWPRRWRRFRAG